MDKMRMESVDITDQNIEKIGALFPNCITEAKDGNGKLTKAINFELLKQELSKEVIDGDEAYEFTWVGKKAAIVEANKPIRKTLRPYKEESVNWDTTENLYIEGDNLEVLKLLQESYLGKVKMIYIDPPYNTGHDSFVYNDNFYKSYEDELLESGAINEDGIKMETILKSDGRFHSKWLSNIYPRLLLCRNLLSDNGLIFISIDDNEEANLKKVCDDVFGGSNFICNFIWKSKPQGGNDNPHIVPEHEYILCYAKNIKCTTTGGRPFNPDKYKNRDEYYPIRGGYALGKLDLSTLGYRTNLDYPIVAPDGSMIYAGGVSKEERDIRAATNTNNTNDWQWRWSQSRFEKAKEAGFIEIKQNPSGNWVVYAKEYQNVDRDGNEIKRELKYRTIIDDTTSVDGTTEIRSLVGNRVFSFPKPTKLLDKLLSIATQEEAIVMDFYSGSASFADAVMRHTASKGKKLSYILVQYPEITPDISDARNNGYFNICEIGKERIRRASKKIHEEYPEAKFDDGFRVLKVDESNMTNVYYSPNSYSQDMLAQLESNIKPDRTDLDLLFGCLTEWGLPLSMPYTSEKIDSCAVHTYNDGDLIACFDQNIPENVIEEIAKRKPLRAVFRDSGFKGSPEKINVGETFKLLSPDTRVKII